MATLVKLILDLSEHIWRALERDDFLSAARLEALGRIISSELTSGRWDETGMTEPSEVSETFPIVERQSEALAQLAPQITWRARAFLRKWDVDHHETAAALAAILLLDNTSLMETATLFLQARRTSLNILLNGTSHPLGTWTDRVRNAIQLVTGTIEQIYGIFAIGPNAPTVSVPYFVKLLQAIQESSSTSSQSASRRRIESNGTLPPPSSEIELNPILSMLPNAHQSMRYLPASIITFSPFIPVSLDEPAVLVVDQAMPEFLADWCSASHADLLKTIRDHLQKVDSTSDLVEFRSIIDSTLTPLTSEFVKALHGQIHDALSAHFDALYAAKLTQVRTETLVAISKLEPTLGQPRRRDWIFSDRLPILEPSNAQSFDRMMKSVRARTEGRWGTDEGQIISSLEQVGQSLRNDFEKWKVGSQHVDVEKFLKFGQDFVNELVDGLDQFLKSESIRGGTSMLGPYLLQCVRRRRLGYQISLGLCEIDVHWLI